MFDEGSSGGGGGGWGWRQMSYGFAAREPMPLSQREYMWAVETPFQLDRVLCWAIPGSRLLRVKVGVLELDRQSKSKVLLADIDLDRCLPPVSCEQFLLRNCATRVMFSEPLRFFHALPVLTPLCELGGVELSRGIPEIKVGDRIAVELNGAAWAVLCCGFGRLW